ncbi:unnamed protein product, partial [marine sediment metagenome]
EFYFFITFNAWIGRKALEIIIAKRLYYLFLKRGRKINNKMWYIQFPANLVGRFNIGTGTVGD